MSSKCPKCRLQLYNKSNHSLLGCEKEQLLKKKKKEYYSRPEIKKRQKEYQKEYMKKYYVLHPEKFKQKEAK